MLILPQPTYRALRGECGLHNCPTTQASGKIVKKFKKTEVVTNIERPMHHRFARSIENIAVVSESVAEDPMCRFLVAVRNKDCLTAHYGVFYI